MWFTPLPVLWARLRVRPGRRAAVRPRTTPGSRGRSGVTLRGRGPRISLVYRIMESPCRVSADVLVCRRKLVGPIQL